MSILDTATDLKLSWDSDRVSAIALLPGTQLFRIFRHADMDWEPAPEEYRHGRLDPPASAKGAFGTIYTAESLLTAAFEARAVRSMFTSTGEEIWGCPALDPATPPQQFVQHELIGSAVFIQLEDRATAKLFGLDPDALCDDITMWQRATKAVFDRLASSPPAATIAPIVGVTHQSKHRASNGWNFGFFSPLHHGVLKRGLPMPFDLQQLCTDFGFKHP